MRTQFQMTAISNFSLEFGQFNSSQQYKNFVNRGLTILVFNYDLIAVSDTRLNQSIDSEDIRIEGFSKEIFRSDHPSNSRVPGEFALITRKMSQLNEGRI